MRITCGYCGKSIDDSCRICPHCGAPNEKIVRVSNSQPTTIDELKQWYSDRNLPPENVTRFFIGRDVKEKRAFGIYKDKHTGDYVVYKNKDNGQRAVRYQGKDEKYAVNQLYERLKEEILNQKQVQKAKPSSSSYRSTSYKPSSSQYRPYSSLTYDRKKEEIKVTIFSILIFVAIIFGIIAIGAAILNEPSQGYYKYNGMEYYSFHDRWYYYNDDDDQWERAYGVDSELNRNWHDYYSNYYYSNNSNSHDFTDSSIYKDYSSSSSSSWSSDDKDWGSSWDNDYDWDSGSSWDSGSTDWDSDW